MIHKTAMTKKCRIWSKECCCRRDFEKKKKLLQDFIIEKIPELIALKADAVFASFNPFFNLFFFFFKASLRVDNVPLYGAI